MAWPGRFFVKMINVIELSVSGSGGFCAGFFTGFGAHLLVIFSGKIFVWKMRKEGKDGKGA